MINIKLQMQKEIEDLSRINSNLEETVYIQKREIKEYKEVVAGMHKQLIKYRTALSTECCAECGLENTFEWSVLRQGYKAYCHHCGNKMMLCSECLSDDYVCDWNDDKECCSREEETALSEACWYEEKWYESDLKTAIEYAGFEPTEERTKALGKLMSSMFDDKTERNEMIVGKALEIFGGMHDE